MGGGGPNLGLKEVERGSYKRCQGVEWRFKSRVEITQRGGVRARGQMEVVGRVEGAQTESRRMAEWRFGSRVEGAQIGGLG